MNALALDTRGVNAGGLNIGGLNAGGLNAGGLNIVARRNDDCDTVSSPSDRARFFERIALSDGTRVALRPIGPADRKLELDFLRGLSRQTRYQRLLSWRDLLPGELDRLTNIDYDRQMALIATIRNGGREEEIGVARYVRDDADGAEFAIVIGDCWQRRGLGQKLLSRLIGVAAEAGLHTLTGVTLSTNLAMLRLAKRLGFALRYEPRDATLMRVTLTLGSGSISKVRFDFR